MDKYQECFIIALLYISAVVLFIPTVFFCIRKIGAKLSGTAVKKSSVSMMLIVSACLLGSVWCLRYAVGYFAIISSEVRKPTLTWWEEIFNSMVHALQTFSMDEDYAEYIINGKLMLAEILGKDTVWQTVYGLYASVLNFIVPVAGGAIVFEILAGIFPKIKLRASYFVVWREKYYFSELNDASLALAESICRSKKPFIIFTDAYADNEDEKRSEILLEAKMLGAICVKDDISNVKKNKFGKRIFFLIDNAEVGNLQTLSKLAKSNSGDYLKKAEIYFFTSDDAYIRVAKNIIDKLKVDIKCKDDESPKFIPIQNYRNLISNLLTDIPLYEPLIEKKENNDGEKDLSVTILGTGYIGTEMFLSTYWFGQILNCNLTINIISRETEDEFWNKIDYINPEIRHTTIEGDPILRIYSGKDDTAKVYCKVRYLQCDARSSEFIRCMTDPEKKILSTDYFLVSLGSDEENISLANTIRKYIGQYHIETKVKTNALAKTVITYVVYDSALSDALNRIKYFKFAEEDRYDVYMQAIGSLRDVYSYENVFMHEYDDSTSDVNENYYTLNDRKVQINNYYDYWASLSRVMHRSYKAYSAGKVKNSIFKYEGKKSDYDNERKKSIEDYKEFSKSDSPLSDKLAWLEHRRWNAFTRVRGFRHTDYYDAYRPVTGTYKQMDIKLHPCLVECDQKGIRCGLGSQCGTKEEAMSQDTYCSDWDLLDELSHKLGKDFKKINYPRNDFHKEEDSDENV